VTNLQSYQCRSHFVSGCIPGCSDMWSSPQCSDRLSGLDSCVCWCHTHSCLQYSTHMKG
jgi:hypothetical protein